MQMIKTHITLAALLLPFSALAVSAQQVTDPTTGQVTELADIDFTGLSKSETRDIAGQLRDQGLSRSEARSAIRDAASADFGALEVTDPTTGATVALSDIDFTTLSREQAREVAAQLEAQGIADRPASAAVRSERRSDVGALEVVDPNTGQTVTLSSIDRRSLSDEDRADIRDQLAEQGVDISRDAGRGADRAGRGGDRGGPGGRGGDRGGDTDEG